MTDEEGSPLEEELVLGAAEPARVGGGVERGLVKRRGFRCFFGISKREEEKETAEMQE